MPGAPSEWLLTTINAVRELMIKRLEKHSLDAETEREVQMALEELEVMWEEIEGQAQLLNREHQRYEEFFDYAPDAYVITDAGGNVREANRAATELFALARQDIVSRPLSEFVAESDRVSFLSRFIGMVISAPASTELWRVMIQPAQGPAVLAELSVRTIPLRKSGIGGLCWLIRRVE
jgi:PAS domain S-box-containing protein